MGFLIIFSVFSLFASFASATNVVDFCVADLHYPVTPAGYPCRNVTSLTADDFVFSGLSTPGNISIPFDSAIILANDKTFPALNGLGLSMARADIAVGGSVPLHSHRVSELLLMAEGTIIAGFIGSNNVAYYRTLNKGDIMIFPHTLLHFQVNIGKSPALAFASFNSPSPGFQATTPSLAANDLPSDVVRRITLLDAAQIHKLKRIFGGTN
ncbi:auxin-binding protein ABP20-like [Spinacia oleracea]|uniref:Germin-like protein n=1 Tax=Spinacia oleracea TaxID=3562 RepID=A0A9R0JCY6_SPIOL|nr:auxin-binding protein ABP20-like [Spinacia oleracea]